MLLGGGVVAAKVDHTVANAGSTVAATTFDPIARDVLFLPLSGVCINTVEAIISNSLNNAF